MIISWNSSGGNVCWNRPSRLCGWLQTATALARWSTPLSRSPKVMRTLQMVTEGEMKMDTYLAKDNLHLFEFARGKIDAFLRDQLNQPARNNHSGDLSASSHWSLTVTGSLEAPGRWFCFFRSRQNAYHQRVIRKKIEFLLTRFEFLSKVGRIASFLVKINAVTDEAHADTHCCYQRPKWFAAGIHFAPR